MLDHAPLSLLAEEPKRFEALIERLSQVRPEPSPRRRRRPLLRA